MMNETLISERIIVTLEAPTAMNNNKMPQIQNLQIIGCVPNASNG